MCVPLEALEECRSAKVHVSVHDPRTEGYQLITGQRRLPPTSPLAEAALGRGVNDMFTVNGCVDYVIREVA